MASDGEVMIFWDLNNTPLPWYYDADTLMTNINASLQGVRRLGHNYYVGGIRYMIGDWSMSSKKLSEEQLKAIHQVHCFKTVQKFESRFMCSVHRERYTDIYEKSPIMALIDELGDQLKQDGPRNILFITGDPDLEGIMTRLRNCKYTIFLAHPEDADLEFRKGSNYAWVWETEMLKGLGPISMDYTKCLSVGKPLLQTECPNLCFKNTNGPRESDESSPRNKPQPITSFCTKQRSKGSKMEKVQKGLLSSLQLQQKDKGAQGLAVRDTEIVTANRFTALESMVEN